MIRKRPYRVNWPNYGPLERDKFHSHLKQGRPTYVTCWEIVSKEKKIIEYIMSAHMKTHHTKTACEVIVKIPGQKKFVPIFH